MDRRFLTVLGVSLVFALVVSTLFYSMTSSKGSRPQPTDQKDIVMAAKPLGMGATIQATDVKVGKVPSEAFPKGAFSKTEDVLGRSVVSNILMEEPLVDGRLAPRGSGIGLGSVIPAGMRGVTVRVNDISSVAGFVLPGSRVDILITGRPPTNEGQAQTITKTLLQNIQVLSVGQNMQTDGKGQPINAPNVTLLATPEQAEILTLANNEAHIQLVLRSGSDQTVEQTTGTASGQLYGGKKWKGLANAGPGSEEPPKRRQAPKPVVAEAKPPSPPPAPPPPDQIVVIRGDKRTVETIPNRPDGSR